jgi:hypothetical protein
MGVVVMTEVAREELTAFGMQLDDSTILKSARGIKEGQRGAWGGDDLRIKNGRSAAMLGAGPLQRSLVGIHSLLEEVTDQLGEHVLVGRGEGEDFGELQAIAGDLEEQLEAEAPDGTALGGVVVSPSGKHQSAGGQQRHDDG